MFYQNDVSQFLDQHCVWGFPASASRNYGNGVRKVHIKQARRRETVLSVEVNVNQMQFIPVATVFYDVNFIS